MAFTDFFYQAAIYLLAAVLSVPLAKRLGFGSVLGYLIAGIIIGPFVLGAVGDNQQDIMHFAEFGVVLMLFIIGLELRPSLLWRLRGQIFGLGLSQVLLTTFALMSILLLMNNPFRLSLVTGMIFAMSSTAIVLQIFTEKGWIRSPVGQATFSVLLFQDIAVIPMMALFPILALSSFSPQTHTALSALHLKGYQEGLITLGIIILLILGGRFILRPIFRFIAKANLREIFTAASLLLVIASALLMEALGLSAALGTFLAGALLAESEYRHELEADIEPFKGLLLGIFFISVGANIDFNILRDSPMMICKLISLIIIGKAIVLYFLAKSIKLNTQNALLFALTLAQGGEFCFVLLSFASQLQILPQSFTAQMIVAVAFSMLFTPLLILIYEKVIAPYFIRHQNKEEFDHIENQKNPVVIAGFGRFGQIIGRLLFASKIKVTVLDLDSQTIELTRKFGFKVFYGDASRLDLLEAAGIAHAKLFILAIDDSDKALEIAIEVRQRYPDLKILARVRGRTQAYEFLKSDFNDVYRETFHSSLAMGVDALVCLGYDKEQAKNTVELFKQYDEASMLKLFKLYGQEKDYIDEAKQSRKNLEQAIADQL